jgi:hypothetical protein
MTSAKYRQLSRDPRIALCIDAGHPDARAVCISGKAKFVADGDPKRADLEWRILRRYHETDEDARRWEASVAAEGPAALVEVLPGESPAGITTEVSSRTGYGIGREPPTSQISPLRRRHSPFHSGSHRARAC